MGYCEHNPEWNWKAVAETISEAINSSKINPKYIRGVGISALSPACILVDEELNALQYSHIWMDRRSLEQTDWLIQHIGHDNVFELTGNTIDTYYGITKLMWERDNRPDLYKKAYKIQNASDYPRMKLTGEAVTDYSNASVMGIAFNIREKKWDEDLLHEINIDIDKLPELYPCEEVVGHVTKESSLFTNLPFGLSFNHTRGHIIRAMLEGTGYAFKNNFQIIKNSGIKMNFPIVMSEGGARS